MIRKTYIRETDGAVMVEVKPGSFVNERIARQFALIQDRDKLVEPRK